MTPSRLLAAFGSSLREEVDLDDLQVQIVQWWTRPCSPNSRRCGCARLRVVPEIEIMKKLFISAFSHRIDLARILILAWMASQYPLSLNFLASQVSAPVLLEPENLTGAAFSGWTAQQIQTVRNELGLSPEVVAVTMFLASLICLLCFWAIGGLLFWRKSDTWFGLLAALILFMTGPGFSGLFFANQSSAPVWLNQL